ncbi:UNVERIFIED_CONTAM: hypothetical protein GTU68_012214 [Idotea baltica]|nr:hypothetical protein [Idotea baltica]
MVGRHPKSDIVIDNVAVSRHHAQITNTSGQHFVEDLNSRNGTIINGETIEGRVLLRDGDQVRICDVVFSYYLNAAPDDSIADRSDDALKAVTTRDVHFRIDNRKQNIIKPGAIIQSPGGSTADSDSSIIVAKLSADGSGSSWRLGVKPAIKLQAVLELSGALRTAECLDDSLAIILETMFRLFPQAEEGFILLRDPSDGQLRVRTTLVRNAKEFSDDVHFSMLIVHTAMQTQHAILSSDAASDIRFRMSESIQQLQIRSMMCAPIVGTTIEQVVDDEDGTAEPVRDAFGVVQIGTKELSMQFTEEELDIMVSVTSQAAMAIEHMQLAERLSQRKALDRELEVANQIQQSFLPGKKPEIEGYQFANYYKPAENVGGDYYDYIAMPDGRIAIAVADVSGKGVPAALLMARLCSMARVQILANRSPARALIGLNDEFAEHNLNERMVTMVIGMLDPQKHELVIASAGHPAMLLRHRSGKIETIGSRDEGIPLGVVDRQTISETAVQLEPGATCLLYSDGINEAMNDSKDCFTTARMTRYLETHSDTADGLTNGLVASVDKFVGDAKQHDDMCIVCIQRDA